MGKVHPDLMRPPGLELAGQQRGDRPPSRPLKAACSSHGHRPRPESRTAIFRGQTDGGRSGASTVPRARFGTPPDKGHSRAASAQAAMVGELRCQRLVRSAFLATTISRCPCSVTMPGRRTPPMERLAPQWAISAPPACGFVAGGRMTKALRLVDDDDVANLKHDIERCLPLGSGAGRTSIVIVSPLPT